MIRVIIDENEADKTQNVRRVKDGQFIDREILVGATIFNVEMNKDKALVLTLDLEPSKALMLEPDDERS